MTALHTVAPAKAPAMSQLVAMLVAALDTEARLVTKLLDVMKRQRAAVARGDVEALEAENGAAHRVLTTLGEAKRYRSTLNEQLGESADLRLSAIAEWFGGAAPTALEAAVLQLAHVARVLDDELLVNQQVLRAVSASTDREVRMLLGAVAAPAIQYQASPEPCAGRSVLVDRKG
ncbi:MAG: flagellar export chaperone FlgN [Gemmatimonadaceae bacterium]|nr:flagellar export chaperone FlgN [Gemmatimonadaceae bacterium]